jgi:hypothetical protein
MDKQRELAEEARALHAGWLAACGCERPSPAQTDVILAQVDARAAELAAALEQGTIAVADHNEGRFVMTMALRRLIDAGPEEPAARRIARAMLDLYLDSPPLPDPKYSFTFDWASDHTAAWAADLAHLAGQPCVYGLEVGCYEGRSACWWLDNVLTHPTSRLTCVDVFAVPMASVLLRNFEPIFDGNVAATGAGNRVTKLVGPSQTVMRTLPASSFDFAYVDGSHRVGDVLQDAVLAWGLLKPGGIAIFDDYGLVDDVAPGLQARAPGRALDAFVPLLGSTALVMRRDWQLVLRKV